ncbi:MAG TPA: hypothetical protein VGE39_18610 [Prosthecobacter sp.]
MPPPAEPLLQDDASGEAWYQKGVTLLEGRKQERETEDKLRKAMARSVLQEWQAWLGLFMGFMAIFQAHLGCSPSIVGPTALSSVVMLIAAIDNANAKRTQAILDWIEHQRQKEKAAQREGD